MENNSQIIAVITSIAWALPLMLIYLIGIILSIVFRQRLGRIWLVPIFAFLLHILAGVISVIVQNALSYYLLHGGDRDTYPILVQTSNAITLLLRILADILLLIALFAKRK
jgi:hypothetical protein